MGASEIIAENRIAAAMAAGAFDSLPGRGAPLRLEDGAAVSGEWGPAHRLLRDNGFAPVWIEEAGAIRRDLARARAELQVVAPAAAGRSGAEARYAARAGELNRRIASCNLLAPAARWHLLPIDIDRDRMTLGG